MILTLLSSSVMFKRPLARAGVAAAPLLDA
jgi:hypothetical protein